MASQLPQSTSPATEQDAADRVMRDLLRDLLPYQFPGVDVDTLQALLESAGVELASASASACELP